MHYTGLLYRALNPVWARDPLSGAGAARYGGRFNRIGRPALYTAFDPATALRETALDIGADLLVIGRSAVSGMLGRLSKNSYSIISHSPCPVVSV